MTARDDVLAALKRVADPLSGQDLVSAGLVRALTVDGGAVRFVIEIDPARAELPWSPRAPRPRPRSRRWRGWTRSRR